MKKHLIVVVAALLACSVVVGLVGCGGGDTSKAKDYMNKGDKIMESLKTKSEKMGTDLETTLTKLGTDIQSGKMPDAATFASTVAGIDKTLTELTTGAASAKAEYEKIKGLTGVDDYVKYANLRIEQIDTMELGVAELKTYLDDTAKSLQSGSFDPVAWGNTSMEFGKKMQEMGTKADKLGEEADQLKKDKKL